MRILTGDIGGTKTRLALISSGTGSEPLTTICEQTYPSAEFGSLDEIVGRFLEQLDERPAAAGFGLSGPVAGRRCQVTNLPWTVNADQLESRFRIPSVLLLNDLEATAWGIAALPADDLITLQQGDPLTSGNRMVIAAGTGLGQAGLFWDGRRHHPFATEGGHCDFAPQSPLECELLAYLQQKYGQVSWERVVSGPGLVEIHRFLSRFRDTPIPAGLAGLMESGDPAAAISKTARDGSDPICREAMELFTRLYGAEAGNQALKQMATGGVFIGGGIAPRILDWLQRPAFIDAFRNKGPMGRLMGQIAVKVIINDRAALYGPVMRIMAEDQVESP